MSDLVLVDTSVFIDYLRGSSDDELAILTLNNQVLLSPVVKLELLAGAKKKQVAVIERLCSALHAIESFPILVEIERLLRKAKGSGLLGGIPDLLIIADAIRYEAPLFTYDRKMEKLATKLGAEVMQL